MTDLRTKLIRLAHENPSLRSDILPLLKESSAASKEWEVVSVPEAKRLKDEAKKKGLKIRSRASGSTIMVQVEDGASFAKVHELAESLFPSPKFKVKPPLTDKATGFEIQLQPKALEDSSKKEGASKKLNEKELDKALASHQKGQGLRIVNKDNPSWGEWQVTKKTTHDGTPWFDIRGDRGSRTLSIDEAEDHWEFAPEGKRNAAPVVAGEALRLRKEIRILEQRIGSPLEIYLPDEDAIANDPKKFLTKLKKVKDLAEKVLEARLAYVKEEGGWSSKAASGPFDPVPVRKDYLIRAMKAHQEWQRVMRNGSPTHIQEKAEWALSDALGWVFEALRAK